MLKLKFLKILILSLLSFLCVFSIISLNYISTKTIEKNFYSVKEKDVDYIKRINEDKFPIINNNSIRDFAKKSLIQIFNYENAFAIDKIESLESLFSRNGYINFYPIFEFVVDTEFDQGVVLKEVVISDGPYFMGTYNLLDVNIYQVYMEIIQSKYGLSGQVEHDTKKVFILVREDSFTESNKGLSIEGITII